MGGRVTGQGDAITLMIRWACKQALGMQEDRWAGSQAGRQPDALTYERVDALHGGFPWRLGAAHRRELKERECVLVDEWACEWASRQAGRHAGE